MAPHFLVLFSKWIMQFSDERTDRGVLARLIKSSPDFPNQGSESAVITYMTERGASPELLKVVDEVWREFESFPFAKIQGH